MAARALVAGVMRQQTEFKFRIQIQIQIILEVILSRRLRGVQSAHQLNLNSKFEFEIEFEFPPRPTFSPSDGPARRIADFVFLLIIDN
jgi:hypothetical protein